MSQPPDPVPALLALASDPEVPPETRMFLELLALHAPNRSPGSFCSEEGYYFENQILAAKVLLPSRREIQLIPKSYGRVAVVDCGPFEYPCGWGSAWWFNDYALAFAAFQTWTGDGEPDGWFRHDPSDRRRPDGDPAREYVPEH